VKSGHFAASRKSRHPILKEEEGEKPQAVCDPLGGTWCHQCGGGEGMGQRGDYRRGRGTSGSNMAGERDGEEERGDEEKREMQILEGRKKRLRGEPNLPLPSSPRKTTGRTLSSREKGERGESPTSFADLASQLGFWKEGGREDIEQQPQ